MCVCVSLPYNPHCLASSSQECTKNVHINPAHKTATHLNKRPSWDPQHFANSRSETFLRKFPAHPISLGSCIEGKLPGHRFLSYFIFFKKMCQVVIQGSCINTLPTPQQQCTNTQSLHPGWIYNQTFSVLPSDSVFPATSEVNSWSPIFPLSLPSLALPHFF